MKFKAHDRALRICGGGLVIYRTYYVERVEEDAGGNQYLFLIGRESDAEGWLASGFRIVRPACLA